MVGNKQRLETMNHTMNALKTRPYVDSPRAPITGNAKCMVAAFDSQSTSTPPFSIVLLSGSSAVALLEDT